ncbi:MAG: hypothetical protein J6M35_05815, partial [Clostridia bacterium]|nr:hypothetical protein [Clostridia bacterium]
MKRIRENPMNDRLKKLQKEVKEETEHKKKEETAENKKFLSIWERYELTKKEHPEHIAMIRVGDFYEFFYDDAKTVANVLDLTLTSRQKDENERVPMCGVPYHALERYLQKILDAGYAVAAYEEEKIYPIISAKEKEAPEQAVATSEKREIKDEVDAVCSFVEAMHLDIDVDYDYNRNEIIAKDKENEWRGKALFEFLLNDVASLDENYMLAEGMGENQPIIDNLIKYAKKYGANISTVSKKEEIKTVDELERAKQYISSFCEAEYGDSEIEISDLSKVPIAHTTIGDEDYPVNVYADLTGFRILKYLSEDLIEVSGYGSLKEL